ncbi:glycosyltransferase family 4 protein [Sphingorhabdus sp.]|uniref:glycosyltransferase family 4 protein n=1 Tax=Sphingorhabdus sp. TaxID=1902408 RepID=UPI0032B76DD9
MHGAASINSEVVNCTYLNDIFEQSYVAIQLSSKLHEVGYFSIYKIWRAFFNIILTTKAILNKRPDMVYFAMPPHGGGFYASVPLVLLLKIFRLKILYHFHGKGFDNNARSSKIYRTLIRWATAGTASILLSDRLKSDAESWVQSETIWFLPNFGPNVAQIEAVSEDGVPHIIFLSNLVESKGPLELLEALQLLKSRGVKFKATFAGNPHPPITYEGFLANIKAKGLSDVVSFGGPVYGEEKDKLLRSADALALPTRYPNEAFPLVVLEAMAYGLAVVATPEGAIPDMVEHGANGFLVESRDVSGLADSLQQLICNPTLRTKMGAEGQKKIVERFSRDVFNKRMGEIWAELISSPLPHRSKSRH